MGLFLGYLFCSIHLYVCSYATTRLFWLQWLCGTVWYQILWSLLLRSSFSRFDQVGMSIQWSKNSPFNKWCWDDWAGMCKKMKIDHQLTPYTRINSKQIKGLDISHGTIKALEENLGRTISNNLCSSSFANISSRAREIKEKINKWDYIILKSFCTDKETIIKMKSELTLWENIFANDTSDMGLISKIYKELIWLSTRKTNNPIKKWAKDLNRHFSKEDIQRAQRHMKGYTTSLAIREMQIKTTTRYHLTARRKTIINKSTDNKYWRGYGKGNPNALLMGMQTGAATGENSMEFYQKTKNGTAFNQQYQC